MEGHVGLEVIRSNSIKMAFFATVGKIWSLN